MNISNRVKAMSLMKVRRVRGALLVLICLGAPQIGRAAEPASNSAEIDDRLNAAEAEGAELDKYRSPWNEVDLGLITARVGGGFLYDTAAYDQNEASAQQLALSPSGNVRDFRVLLKGRFKFAPRFSYTLGYMYDGQSDDWLFRQTGIMVDLKELSGHLFVGRTKEGFSTSKIMVGYFGWTNERSAANDAFLPILADGIKWTGTGFGGRLVYNLGWFAGSVTNQSYAKNDHEVAARSVWLPLANLSNQQEEKLLHVALEARYGSAKNGSLQFRSKPESNPAQVYAIDTGKFPASGNTLLGFETYYRPGPLMFGTEYYLNFVSSSETGNPFFHGGDIFTAYLLTGEKHPYNASSAFFEMVAPSRSVFSGGPGAWEVVLRYSYADLNSAQISGGRFWRITPMVNWYLSENVRTEFVYGYSVLDRDGKIGGTYYYQTRIQFTLM